MSDRSLQPTPEDGRVVETRGSSGTTSERSLLNRLRALRRVLLSTAVAVAFIACNDRKRTCSVAEVKRAGEVCKACHYSMAADMQSCAMRMEGTGLALRCKSDGETSWTEVWCGPADGLSP